MLERLEPSSISGSFCLASSRLAKPLLRGRLTTEAAALTIEAPALALSALITPPLAAEAAPAGLAKKTIAERWRGEGR